ncbi:hypothetical protein C7444_11231 [Sphaerotilus hippei]|uniref:Uncharacterized protein n=1 Tax=Sphaerotilus hippei TaxID=744406 RepID=A0A318H244_9BURK|nr:hypothetical protein [Sphaerotilus hippei]PXW94716.1 hypothetical protein C7444_11231 [Sphaerotilus hippei]
MSPRTSRWAATAVITAALLAVFASYFQPGLIVDLGNRLWSCF